MIAPNEIIRKLHKCFTAETACGEWKEEVPALNQCAVAALVIQDLFGGVLLRAPMSDGDGHYYNRIESGVIIDPTASQLPHVEATVDFDKSIERTRQYVLSYPDTMRRYSLLLNRLADILEGKDDESRQKT